MGNLSALRNPKKTKQATAVVNRRTPRARKLSKALSPRLQPRNLNTNEHQVTNQPPVAPVEERNLRVITKAMTRKKAMTKKINLPAIMDMVMVGLSSISETSCMCKET